MNELKKYLLSIGFKVSINSLRSKENLCDWYAYRQSKLKSRRCQCNDDKEFMQIVVKPHWIEANNIDHSSVEIELSGEVNNVWYELKAYGVSIEEVKEKLDSIEESLIAAWNALDEK